MIQELFNSPLRCGNNGEKAMKNARELLRAAMQQIKPSDPKGEERIAKIKNALEQGSDIQLEMFVISILKEKSLD